MLRPEALAQSQGIITPYRLPGPGPRQDPLYVGLVWRIREAIYLGAKPSASRIRDHTSKTLNLVWFSDLKFLSAEAIETLGTSNPPH